MSLKAMEWAFEQTDPRMGERLVLLVLADYANAAHCCYPSMRRIAERAGLTLDSARACMRRLEAMGLVVTIVRRREGDRNRSNLYYLAAPDPDIDPEDAEHPFRTGAPAAEGVTPPLGADPGAPAPEGVTSPPSGVGLNRKEGTVTIEPKVNANGRGRRHVPEGPLPEDWEPTEVHQQMAAERHLDLAFEAQQFRAHAEANDRWQASWNGAFTTWLGKARPRPAALPGLEGYPPRRPSVREQNMAYIAEMERAEAQKGITR